MSASEILRDALEGDAAVSALAGLRVYLEGTPPVDAQTPYVVVQELVSVPTLLLSGEDTGHRTVTCQIDVWASSPEERDGLGRAAAVVLDRMHRGAVSASRIAMRDAYERSVGLPHGGWWRRTIDVEVAYNEMEV